MRSDWLASKTIVIQRLDIDIERNAAGAVDSRLLTIPELHLVSLEGLPEISNSTVSYLDQ
jgi:hypothetical protein